MGILTKMICLYCGTPIRRIWTDATGDEMGLGPAGTANSRRTFAAGPARTQLELWLEHFADGRPFVRFYSFRWLEERATKGIFRYRSSWTNVSWRHGYVSRICFVMEAIVEAALFWASPNNKVERLRSSNITAVKTSGVTNFTYLRQIVGYDFSICGQSKRSRCQTL